MSKFVKISMLLLFISLTGCSIQDGAIQEGYRLCTDHYSVSHFETSILSSYKATVICKDNTKYNINITKEEY